MDTVDRMAEDLRREVVTGYVRAAKQAIVRRPAAARAPSGLEVNYIAMDKRSADRAGLLLVPRVLPQWGSIPFTVPDIRTPGGPPEEWRMGLEKARRTQ